MARRYEQIEWLSLVDIAGPFLAGVVLNEVFPQGLEKIETPRRQHIRAAYEEWDDARDESDPDLDALHREWTKLVLEEALEFESEVLASRSVGDEVPIYEPPSHEEVYSPDYVLRSLEGNDLLYVALYAPGTHLTQPISRDWVASPIERMKLLCRSQKVRVGLVTNGEQWILVNAPEDNTSGHTTWYARLWWLEPVTFKAFVSLLGVRRFFGPPEERLDQLLQRSLKEHHEVTKTLGEQVRRAVEVLVQALGRADEDRNGELLKGLAPADLYNAGLTIMMRLVFLLCAEERELLLLGDPVYDQHYAISTLRAKLREDADHYGVEVLERRYDAWSRLLSVFRAVYGGIEHEALRMPALGGSLFDPDRFPFLEGRAKGSSWRDDPATPLPIDNRTVLLLLKALQVLEHRGGARLLSYRGLDVEQIGHVYEGLLEYKVERVPGLTLGLLGSAKVKRPTVSLMQLESLVAAGVSMAAGELVKVTGRSKPAITKALKREPELSDLPPLVHACGGDEVLARRLLPFVALLRADSWGVPLVYNAGSFAVTLGTGRRESGAHYTPKALTEPIIATTIRPNLEAMGEQPTVEQLLDLKICDPAMGSGAFLVEACRQLAARVVEAWSRAEACGSVITVRGQVVEGVGNEELLSNELADRLVTARRLVSERCLYGVDKNPMAVDLAKMSLWLVTLAKGRPLGFLDHKFKHGDSLVGLANNQIQAFHWNQQQRSWGPLFAGIRRSIDEAKEWRRAIGDFGEFDFLGKAQVYRASEESLSEARLLGDLCVAAFFNANADKPREALRGRYRTRLGGWRNGETGGDGLLDIVEGLRAGEKPVPPLHWELEFPEVYGRANPGFDVIVGNPPFFWGNRISSFFGPSYRDWLASIHPGAHGNGDLVAHFVRRAHSLVRAGGTFGFVTTNSISEADTRTTGLQFVLSHGSLLYAANRNRTWAGVASVRVSHVFCIRGSWDGEALLDGKPVSRIGADLREVRSEWQARGLASQRHIGFKGVDFGGAGFLLKPTEVQTIREKYPDELAFVWPVMNASDFTGAPALTPTRSIINFTGHELEYLEDKAPFCLGIIESRVRPKRASKKGKEAVFWWHYRRAGGAYIDATAGQGRLLINPVVSKFISFGFVNPATVFTNAVNVFSFEGMGAFCVMQSGVHQHWALWHSSSLRTDPRYNPTDCFETFPFPEDWQSNRALEASGGMYYDFRAELMIRHDEGLTKTYNRYHDPNNDGRDIVRLRNLHLAMDRAVLNAYNWPDIPTDCAFFLDNEAGEDTKANKKKRYRYRWPSEVHDEVLARLLDLNQKRFTEEVTAGLHDKKGKKQAPKKKPKRKSATPRSKSPRAGIESSAVDLFDWGASRDST